MSDRLNPFIITFIFLFTRMSVFASSLQDEFEHLQWAINNSGQKIEVSLSDIDRVIISNKKGEDVGLDQSKGKKILVAVLDSGIDLFHPDLVNQIYTNPKECEASKKYKECLERESEEKICHEKWAKFDSDQNGYPMDCHGWNVAAPVNEYSGIQGNNNVQDLIGHGTFVSGVMAAEQNEIGVKGISQNITILPVKVSGSEEEVAEENSTDIFAKGLSYALAMGAKVINLSVGWASNEDSVLVTKLIDEALEKGVLVIAAGGNSAHSDITYPCSYSGVICVGSHDPDGSLSYFSNFGSSIDIFAPGRKILSTWPMGLRPKDFVQKHGYEYKNGTSFAAPYVAGAAAHLLSLGYTSEEVRAKIIRGSRGPMVSPGSKGYKLDVKKAIKFQPLHFIAPFKKSPALINWGKDEKKARFSFKNYLNNMKNVSVKISHVNDLYEFEKDEFLVSKWSKGEVKEFDFKFKSRDDEVKESRLNFKIKLSSGSFIEEFPMQATALTIIHPGFKGEGVDRIKYRGKLNLSHFEFFPFKNITSDNKLDQLLIKKESGGLKLSLLKQTQKSVYISSPVHEFKIPNGYIGHTARMNVGGSLRYYVFIFYQNTDTKWKTKLLAFDEKFKPLPDELLLGDEYDNILTTMSGDIKWIRSGNEIEPCWISQGFIPKEDLPPIGPWDRPVSNDYQNRVFCISKKRLKTVYLEGEKRLIGFIPQTDEEKKNLTYRVLLRSNEFVSQFFTSNFWNHEKLKEINYHFVGSLNNIVPQFDKVNNRSFLFYKDFSTTENFVYTYNDSSNKLELSQIYHSSLFDPLQMIMSGNSKEGFFGLTKYNLVFSRDKNTYETESLNTNRLNQYMPIKGENALYLSSNFTPGFYSEFIYFNGEKLLRDPNKSFLPFHGCIELPIINNEWESRQFAHFYCGETKTFFLIPLKK